jgi:hypothetical protein
MNSKVILLKESDINNGLTLLEYIDWCSLFNRSQLYPSKQIFSSSNGIDPPTKQELDDYYLNKGHGCIHPGKVKTSKR